MSVIVCDKKMLLKLTRVHSKCPTLYRLICMDSISETVTAAIILSIHEMSEIAKNGSMSQHKYVINEPDDFITIIYTSESPKFHEGAMISDDIFRNTFPIRSSSPTDARVRSCYQPLAWITYHKAIIAAFFEEGCTEFSTGNVFRFMEQLALVAFSSFSMPPTFWNKIYSEFHTSLSLPTVTNEDNL